MREVKFIFDPAAISSSHRFYYTDDDQYLEIVIGRAYKLDTPCGPYCLEVSDEKPNEWYHDVGKTPTLALIAQHLGMNLRFFGSVSIAHDGVCVCEVSPGDFRLASIRPIQVPESEPMDLASILARYVY